MSEGVPGGKMENLSRRGFMRKSLEMGGVFALSGIAGVHVEKLMQHQEEIEQLHSHQLTESDMSLESDETFLENQYLKEWRNSIEKDVASGEDSGALKEFTEFVAYVRDEMSKLESQVVSETDISPDQHNGTLAMKKFRSAIAEKRLRELYRLLPLIEENIAYVMTTVAGTQK